ARALAARPSLFLYDAPLPTALSTLSLHDALPILAILDRAMDLGARRQREAESGQHGLFVSEGAPAPAMPEDLPDVAEWSEAERRSEEHTSELQSRGHLVCRLLLEKKKAPGLERSA